MEPTGKTILSILTGEKMAYFKIADLVALDEIKQLMEVDAKPQEKISQKEEDSVDKFWELLFSSEKEIEQEDFNGDETSENSRSYWEGFD